MGKSADERQTEPLEVVLLDQLVQVHPGGGRTVKGVGSEGCTVSEYVLVGVSCLWIVQLVDQSEE